MKISTSSCGAFRWERVSKPYPEEYRRFVSKDGGWDGFAVRGAFQIRAVAGVAPIIIGHENTGLGESKFFHD